MASQHGDRLLSFRNRVLLLVLPFFSCNTTIVARERLNEVTFGFASGFGIKARFQNPSMPIPTYPGTASSVAGRSIYKYNDGYVDGGGKQATFLERFMVDLLRDLGLVLRKFNQVLRQWCFCL